MFEINCWNNNNKKKLTDDFALFGEFFRKRQNNW